MAPANIYVSVTAYNILFDARRLIPSQTLSKRSTTALETPIIVGIVCGIVAFVLLLLIVWFFFWSRWRKAQTQKKVPKPVRRLSLESKSSFDLPPGMTKIMPDPPLPSPTGSTKYFQMLSSLQRSPLLRDSSSPPPSSPVSRGPSKIIWKTRTAALPSDNGSDDKYSAPRRASTKSPLMRFKSGVAALSRSSSITSASVYSAASAPSSDHDRILRQSMLPPVPGFAPPQPMPDAPSETVAMANMSTGIRPLPPIQIPGKLAQPATRRLSAQVRKLPPIPDAATLNSHARSLSMDLNVPVMAPVSLHDDLPNPHPAHDLPHMTFAAPLDMTFATAGSSMMSFFGPSSSAPSPAPSDYTQSSGTPWRTSLPPVAPLVIVPRGNSVLLSREEMAASPPHVCPMLQAEPDVPAPQVPVRSPMRNITGI
ncbi:hypothetical protein OE88DRAFT_1805997 [Heliocybe sulcata]|uniref:Uncharacterized protein n=1 Tax=Heliocybe sulcata TaxID=5364 RepID=A0A5C3NB31_9AGAM|nr:hypothetical protein OE88DRAFT_1805997 [Heliocybe sulcata]